MTEADRESWGTRIGFLLAAVGSAVGLGNIWRFPYLTADSGGAAFLLVYILAIVLIGVPAILAEFVIGRRTHQNVIDAYRGSGGFLWGGAGIIAAITAALILAYYSVVGGWVLQYIIASVTGAYFGDPAMYFESISTGTSALLFDAIFMGITIIIVAFGIERGIELSTKIMVPAIVVFMLGLAVWASRLGGAASGYRFYLSPNISKIISNFNSIIPAAVGQALFTLSLGDGIMVTYASYLGEDESLLADGFSIAVLNTVIGVLAGFVVFPLLFAQGVSPGQSGSSAIFVSLATAFQNLPFGRVIGVIFFSILAIAALSSAISILEVCVSYVIDTTDIGRPTSTIVVGVAIYLLGVPTALNSGTFAAYDSITATLLLPLGALFAVVFVGWVYGQDAVEELRQGAGNLQSLSVAWLWYVRTFLLIAVVGTLIISVFGFLGITI